MSISSGDRCASRMLEYTKLANHVRQRVTTLKGYYEHSNFTGFSVLKPQILREE